MDNLDIKNLRRMIRESLVRETNNITQNENMDFSTGEKIRDDGHEVSMAESELYKIAEYAPEIYGMIENYEDLPGWVQKKITIASENISSVKHYLEHEHFRNKSGLDKQ